MMKKILFLITTMLVLSSCSQMIYLACNEPDVEVFINEQNYGNPPVQIQVTNDVQYLNVSFRRNGVELHHQRVYIVDGQNYYDITLPRHLRHSSSPDNSLRSKSY